MPTTNTPTDPEVHVFHRTAGWTVLALSPDVQDCTTNHIPNHTDHPCTDTAVWKVVEDHGMHLTLSFWCDNDLPDERRHLAPRTAA